MNESASVQRKTFRVNTHEENPVRQHNDSNLALRDIVTNELRHIQSPQEHNNIQNHSSKDNSKDNILLDINEWLKFPFKRY